MAVTSTFLQADFGSFNCNKWTGYTLLCLSWVNSVELGHLIWQDDTSTLMQFALMEKVWNHGNCCRHFRTLALQSQAVRCPSLKGTCKTSILRRHSAHMDSPHNNFLIPSIYCLRPVNEALKLSNNTFQW